MAPAGERAARLAVFFGLARCDLSNTTGGAAGSRADPVTIRELVRGRAGFAAMPRRRGLKFWPQSRARVRWAGDRQSRRPDCAAHLLQTCTEAHHPYRDLLRLPARSSSPCGMEAVKRSAATQPAPTRTAARPRSPCRRWASCPQRTAPRHRAAWSRREYFARCARPNPRRSGSPPRAGSWRRWPSRR